MQKLLISLVFCIILATNCIAGDTFTGSWRGTIDNSGIELVLWPWVGQKIIKFYGYAYIFEHDCLLFATVHQSGDQSKLYFNTSETRDRINNCACNTDSLDGPYRFKFEGAGQFAFADNHDVINFTPQSLYLGKEIKNTKSKKNADRDNVIVFKRTPLSANMLEIFNEYNTSFKPEPEVLAQMTIGMDKDKVQPSRTSSKPNSVVATSTPYHSEKFLTRWKSELYDLKNKKYILCAVDVSRRADGKLVLKIKTKDSSSCIGELVEDGLFSSGYIVKLSPNSESKCRNNTISRGYLHPESPPHHKWQHLQLYNGAGELVATGPIDGIKGGLEGVINPNVVYDIEKKVKAIEKDIMLAELKAVDPQTIFTQCRILEYSWNYTNSPEWCLCLDEQYQEQLSPVEYRNAVKDYLSFHRLAGKNPSESGDWRYNNVQNYCRRCSQQQYKGCLLRDDRSL